MKTKMTLMLKGTDLAELAKRALAKADTLCKADWTIEEADVWGEEDAQAREGMVIMFSVTFKLVADVAISD